MDAGRRLGLSIGLLMLATLFHTICINEAEAMRGDDAVRFDGARGHPVPGEVGPHKLSFASEPSQPGPDQANTHDSAANTLNNFPVSTISGKPPGLFSSDAAPLNRFPVIGVLSQPGDGLDACRGPCSGADNVSSYDSYDSYNSYTSYISASYVKFAESGGARVVPLVYNRPWGELLQTLRSINGLLLPGGAAPKSGLFLRRMSQMLQAAMKFNDAGEYFPVFAECLSFEMLAVIISKAGRAVLEEFDATHPSTLIFAGDWVKERSMFAWMPAQLLQDIQAKNLTMQNHKFGLSPSRLLQDPDLSAFFTILTTTMDESGKEYVSTVESKQYPFTAIQWHPEKSAFEWGNAAYPHSTESVQITSAAAIFFVNEARKSSHSFKTRQKLDQAIIYNFNPTFSGRAGLGHYDQVYVFPCTNATGNICYW